MAFTQIITIEGADEEALRDHVSKWHADQAGVAPGYQGTRVLAEGDRRHLIEVDFSSEEAAQRNNERAETASWAEGLRELGDGESSYRDLRRVCTTYDGD